METPIAVLESALPRTHPFHRALYDSLEGCKAYRARTSAARTRQGRRTRFSQPRCCFAPIVLRPRSFSSVSASEPCRFTLGRGCPVPMAEPTPFRNHNPFSPRIQHHRTYQNTLRQCLPSITALHSQSRESRNSFAGSLEDYWSLDHRTLLEQVPAKYEATPTYGFAPALLIPVWLVLRLMEVMEHAKGRGELKFERTPKKGRRLRDARRQEPCFLFSVGFIGYLWHDFR